jgi:hypothetical protein
LTDAGRLSCREKRAIRLLLGILADPAALEAKKDAERNHPEDGGGKQLAEEQRERRSGQPRCQQGEVQQRLEACGVECLFQATKNGTP